MTEEKQHDGIKMADTARVKVRRASALGGSLPPPGATAPTRPPESPAAPAAANFPSNSPARLGILSTIWQKALKCIGSCSGSILSEPARFVRPFAHTGSLWGGINVRFANVLHRYNVYGEQLQVHLVNPSHFSFGTAVITPRWLYVLAGATPRAYGDPRLVDETLEQIDINTVGPGDVVGIGIHTANALRGYEVGQQARARGATVVFGGIHPTLYPDEAFELGGAHAVVQGDGDLVWSKVLADCAAGTPQRLYLGGRINAEDFVPARWDLIPRQRYMWASVQTVRGCPKHCSFCSVWRTDGQKPRQRGVEAVLEEVVQLRRMGFRYIALADDNFYPVSLQDLRLAERQNNQSRLQELRGIRQERFELMARLAQLPADMVFFTQITMEAAEDPEFLQAMHAARIRGALVGVESVTPEGLQDVYKDFNLAGEELVQRLRLFREHGVHVLGSFIFGLPSDRPETFAATAAIAERANISFAQFVILSPFPGTVDFAKWERTPEATLTQIAGVPLSRRWLLPPHIRPRVSFAHPVMSDEEIRSQTQAVWDRFYSIGPIWRRARFIRSLKGRLAFVMISKIYRQMYADTGIATDSARVSWSARYARWLAKPTQRLFAARPMPDLEVPRTLAASVTPARKVS